MTEIRQRECNRMKLQKKKGTVKKQEEGGRKFLHHFPKNFELLKKIGI